MKLTVTTFLSVDSVMQGPGGAEEDPSDGFEQGGWVVPHFDDELGAFMDSVFTRAEAFLLGRGTYNTLPKHVASTTLGSVGWEGATLIEGDVIEAVTALKQAEGGELQVHGSAGLAQTLIDHGLLDEYNLLTFPVVLGKGKRLFGEGAAPTGLKPVSQTTTGAGVRIDVWAAAGEPVVATRPMWVLRLAGPAPRGPTPRFSG